MEVTDREKKVFRGFYEFFCQYLQEQSDNTLNFTLDLETFYPHDPAYHQVILDQIGPALRTLRLDIQLPANSPLSKETIFRNNLHSYFERLNAHIQLYGSNKDKLAEVTHTALEEVTNNAHSRSAVKQNLEIYINENQWQTGPCGILFNRILYLQHK